VGDRPAAGGDGPLSGLKVVDQTQAMAGPYCCMMLGDMGAEVVKVEKPGTGDQARAWGPPFVGTESTYYLGVNRNKRGIAVDISTPRGREIMHALLRDADVFVTNLPRIDTMRRFGLDYETLSAASPRLIMAAISGYGHTGPRAGDFGYDVVAQGESGTMYLTGPVDGEPYKFPTALADMTTGLFCLVGILAALEARHRTGRGQLLDTSLVESQVTWLGNCAGEYFATGEDPPRRGNAHPQVVPYQPVRTSDKWIILAVGSDNIWQRFCRVAGLDHLRDDPRFNTNVERVRHCDLLLEIVAPIMAQRSAREWLDAFRQADIPSGPINTVAEIINDEQLAARGTIVTLEHPLLGAVRSLATPLHFSLTPATYRRYPPMLGEHTHEVLRELGYTDAQIAGMENDGIVQSSLEQL
jgi:crotonobetainyl-CoA:carnitine CoA-transferase CaiB-like acyl-CoA transferase